MPPDLTTGLVVAFVLTTWRHTLLGRAAGCAVGIVFVNRYALGTGWTGRIDTLRSLIVGVLIATVLAIWWDIWRSRFAAE